jgi:hypothetical protein
LLLRTLICGVLLFITIPAKADSINFFFDFLNTNFTMDIMSGLVGEGDGNLDDMIDQGELTSLMVNVAVQPNALVLNLNNADPVDYFSSDLPGDVLLEIGVLSTAPEVVMNFSGAFPLEPVNEITFGAAVLLPGFFN